MLHALTFSGAAAMETCRGGVTVGVPRVKLAELPRVDVLLTKAAGREVVLLLLLGLIIVTVAVADVVEVVVVVVSLLVVVVGAGPMLPMLVIPAGMQRDPPQVSPFGQQAVTPLKTQVGWAAWQVTEQRPTPSDWKQAAP